MLRNTHSVTLWHRHTVMVCYLLTVRLSVNTAMLCS